MRRLHSLQPLSRDHGVDLMCAQHAEKSLRASRHDRLRLAEEVRVVSRAVLLSYLEEEQRVLSPVISEFFLRTEFMWHHEMVRRVESRLVEVA